MDDVRVNGVTMLENVPAIFNTGANFIFGDWDRVKEFYERLGGTLEQRGSMGYYYREFRLRLATLFLPTACSTVRLFPNARLHFWWQDI
jgi:hypothetical protein